MELPPSNSTKTSEILDILERLYGTQKATGPGNPYEMVVFLNCGYPATDASCAKGFEALKCEVGVSSKELLAAPKAKLTRLMRLGGIVPEQRAERLKEIARRVRDIFDGDLNSALTQRLQGGNKPEGQRIREAKKVLQEFPVIGEPSAEKILLFSKLRPVAAVPSAFVGVPIRLFVGEEGKNYAADYRTAREILSAGIPETFEARRRAYLLLKKHGQEICRRSKPKCEICPLATHCAYIQAHAGDSHAE